MSATDLTVRLTLAGTARYGAAHPGASGTKREDGRSVFCTQCGQQNPDDSKFCARCGAPLTVPTPSGAAGGVEQTTTISMTGIEGTDEHAEELGDVGVDSLPAGTALLVVKRGPNAGSRF